MLVRAVIISLFIISLTLQPLNATKISGVEDASTGSWNLTATDSIRRAILPGYDRWVRPANSSTEATSVKFGLKGRHLLIDEAKGIATFVGWMRMVWQDNKLRWNASDYGGIQSIRVSPEEIWKPDLELYNMAAKHPIIGMQARILLYSDGTILWVPPVTLDVFCKLDSKNWPRDSHTCRFVISSWTYDASVLNLTFYDKVGYDGENMSWDDVGSRWMLGDVVTSRLVQYYKCCEEPYVSLQYDMTVTRRGGALVFVNEAPAVTLVVLLIAAALRKPGSRAAILAAVAVISSMFLISLSFQLPHLTEDVPRVAIFYFGLLCLATVWGVTSAVADRLGNIDTRPMPELLRRFLRKTKLNIAVCEEGTVMSDDKEKFATPTVATAEIAMYTWAQFATLLDNAALLTGAVGLVLLFVLNI